MAIRPIVKMGDARLLARAREIPAQDLDTPELRTLIDDMRETMRARDGVGLAAPQIGVGLRLIVFGFDENPRYPDAASVPDTVLINPVLTPLTDETEEDWEGCLSIPGLRGLVPRWKRLRYRGLDPRGQTVERIAEGFHARVVQHECDHLDGILYPMRMRDLSRLGFVDVLFPGREDR